MIGKIIRTLVTIFLVVFPFSGSVLIGKYTPYTEGNSMTKFVVIYISFVLFAAGLLYLITHRLRQSIVQPVLPGILLFLIGCIMMGIAGLAAPPDLSIKMLEHPEREHFRYLLLFAGAILFGLYFLDLFVNNRLQLKGTQRWVIMILIIVAMMELIWEFSHHYLYPEGLKEWMGKGRKAEDFSKNYDDWKAGTMGSIGRLVIYTLIVWLSVTLYKIRSVGIWNPLLNSFLCVFGIVSAVVMFIYFNYNIKPSSSWNFLFLFFIPGMPFLLMYWIGVALLTKRPAQTI